MHARILALALCTLTFCGSNADGSEQLPDKTKRLTAADCEKLVQQLANPSKPPFDEDHVLELPEGQSEAKLLESFKKVEEAYNTLSTNIEVALPVLMKHLGDRRYSFVYEVPSNGVLRKKSVGGACAAIVYEHVEAHSKVTTRYTEDGRPRPTSFISHCGYLDKWWETRRGRNLADLQLEAMQWVQQQEKPAIYKTEKEWRAALAEVKAMADTIRKSNKPIVVEHRVYFFGK